jgi:uncharacterized protein (TIGR02284 family)
MLTRNSQQLALNEVESLCFESADHYASAAAKTSDPELARLFSELEDQRRKLAGELAQHIRALDDLPKQPDPDMEAVDHLLSSVKALFSPDERSALIDESEQFEHKLADAVQAALGEELSEEAKALLGRIRDHVEEAMQRLDAMRSS